MSEEELRKDIKETKYNEENVEKLLYELENDTGNYSCYDNAIAIIYYKDLYQKEKEKNKTLETLLHGNLYEMYLYYKELASRYQANSVSKDKIKEDLKKFEEIEKDFIFTNNKSTGREKNKVLIEYCKRLLKE